VTISRFNHNISSTNYKKVEEYYYLRTKQLLFLGFSPNYDLTPIVMDENLVGVVYRNKAEKHNHYVSLYVLADCRNKGYYKRYLDENPGIKIFTINDCDIVRFLQKNNINFENLSGFFNSNSYEWISEVYGKTKAKRSNQYYMNHIDEGLFIFKKLGLGSSKNFDMWDAFAVHPIFQEDKNLVNIGFKKVTPIKLCPKSIVLAMEYRHVANAHLPKHPIKKPEEIDLGSLPEIKTMLIADKIQNCKDLELYNKNHPSYERLHHYFHNEWFPRLGVTEEFYQECVVGIEGKNNGRT
jgi:hypothetical protein